jgi:Skp family chaperone for outer membrane proteins
MSNGFWKQNVLGLVGVILTIALSSFVFSHRASSPKIAFVNTQRLLMGFKDAIKVNKEVTDEDAKWRGAMKTMDDSLKAFMDSMSVKYDKADLKKKKDMQDELAVRNQEIGNFERVNTQKMQKLSQEKLAAVYQKVDAFLKEFGKQKGYEIIFGSSQGSILYGEGTAADITDEVLGKLNQRYE